MEYHYTYVIFKESTGEYYIGVRLSHVPPQDDPYMGSPSPEVKLRIQTEGDWHKYVIQEYSTRKAAVDDEPCCIEGHLWQPWCLNRSKGGNHYRTTKGKPLSAEHRKKIGFASRNRSAAARKKMSESNKRRVRTPEWNAAISCGLKGRVFTKRHRKKLSVSGKGRVVTPEQRQKIALAKIGKKLSPEHRAAMRAAWARKRQLRQ